MFNFLWSSFEAEKYFIGLEFYFSTFSIWLFRRRATSEITMLLRRCLTWLIPTLKCATLIDFNFDVHNVVSTLIWSCPTLRRLINLATTYQQRWNVCWELYIYILHILHVKIIVIYVREYMLYNLYINV